MQVILVIILILALLLVIFTLQNSMEITLNVLLWEIPNAPLVVILISCVIIGYILASIYFYPRLWKIKREYNQLIKFNEELKELHNLNHPVDETERNPEGVELDEDDDSNSFFRD